MGITFSATARRLGIISAVSVVILEVAYAITLILGFLSLKSPQEPKGIDTAEDALLAREHGADGVVVSNHGGRATDTGRGTIDILPEVVDAVGCQMLVFVDSGFRRGTDIFRALALGARAVGIGRPYVWGLAACGQKGVERVIDILRAELTMTMRNCGVPSLEKFTRDFVLHKGARL